MLLLMRQRPNDVLRGAVSSVQAAQDWVASRPDMAPFNAAIEVAREIYQLVRDGQEHSEEYASYEPAVRKLNERFRRFPTPMLPRGLAGNADIGDWLRRIDPDADPDRAWTLKCLLVSLLFDQIEEPRTAMQLALILVEALTHVTQRRLSRAELVVLAVAQRIGQHEPFDAFGNTRLDDKAHVLRKERRHAKRTMLDAVSRPLALYSPSGSYEEDLFERRSTGTTYRIKDPRKFELGASMTVTTRIAHPPPGMRNVNVAPRRPRGKSSKRTSGVAA